MLSLVSVTEFFFITKGPVLVINFVVQLPVYQHGKVANKYLFIYNSYPILVIFKDAFMASKE
jgi:hypothetical protein